MKIQRRFAIWSSLFLLPLLLGGYIAAKDQKKGNKKSVCSLTNPQSICNDTTSCGSNSNPCIVDVKRTDYASSATPNIPDAKENAPFCLKAGTTVTWQSSSKDTGFVLDFGASSPFDPPDAIIGGSDRPVSVVAKRPRCFKYSVGACKAGATYGMCESTEAELVITGSGN
jgi:hypothetical protein